MINELIKKEKLASALFLVPTPIGNLEDITLRALKIISNADILACEDTRRTGLLLKHYSIHANKLESYHEHNEKEKSDFLTDEIKKGKSIAIITDAGTPGISDPAYRIVQKAIEKKIEIIPLPGPTAFVPALVASGLPVNEFRFFGFPPQKKGRKSFIESLASVDCTMILYESPYRIPRLLLQLSEVLEKDRKICIAREISKLHEEFIRGDIQTLLDLMNQKNKVKGEFVVVIEGKK